jgi:hypothetical protein
METRNKFLKEIPKFNEKYENKFMTRQEKLKLNLPLHKRKITFYLSMVVFSYCFPVYQQLAILLEKKDKYLKQAGWLAMGLVYQEPLSLREVKESHAASVGSGVVNELVETNFFNLEQKFVYGLTPQMFKNFDITNLESKFTDVKDMQETYTLSLTEVKEFLSGKSEEEITNLFDDINRNSGVFAQKQAQLKQTELSNSQFWQF